MAEADDDVSVEIDIEGGRTAVTVTGEQEAAVVVYSESGERIYLPPEEQGDDDSSYRPAGESSDGTGSGGDPYAGIREEGPYDSGRRVTPSVGMNPTANGFRILHPEPVADLRLLR
ncbi:hypothetical protein BRC78_04650 [Halobacteriales archaeon QH_8_68_33]|nr:MAG: hypothetical protein BRC78_04650 [Halobacteriales archaeon QH_8_68_33]